MDKELYKTVIADIEAQFGDWVGLVEKRECAEQIVEDLETVGYRKADASFERYLFDKLLHSAEDYCAYCVRGNSDEPCDENGDDCREGIREFYEKFVEEK